MIKVLHYSNWIVLLIGMVAFWAITASFIPNQLNAYIIDFLYITCISAIIFLAFKYDVSFIFNLILSVALILLAVIWKEYHGFFGDIPSFAMITHMSKAFDNSTGYEMSSRMVLWFLITIVFALSGVIFYIFIFRKIKRNNNRVIIKEVLKAAYIVISFIIPTILTLHISTVGHDWSVDDASYFYSNDYLYKEVYSNKKFAGTFGTTNLLARNFMKTNRQDYTEQDIINYILSRDGHKKNEWTNKYENYNLVNIVVESLDTRLIHPLISPNLHYLMNNSITFDNYYANTWLEGATCNSEWMMLTSMLPALTSDSWTNSLCWDDEINTLVVQDSLPRILGKNGYQTHYVHPGSADTYRRDNIMTNVLGFQNSFFGDSWLFDNKIVDYFNQIDFSVKQFAHVLTVSMHNGWDDIWIDNYLKVKSILPGLRHELLIQYYAKMLETDYVIGEIINKLKRDGVYDKTLISITPDHWLYSFGMPATEMMYTFEFEYKTEYDVMKNVMFIHDGGKSRNNFEHTMSQIDIMPTLLNLLLSDYNAGKMFGKNSTYQSSPVLFQDLSIAEGNNIIYNVSNNSKKDAKLLGQMLSEYEWQKKILKSKYV